MMTKGYLASFAGFLDTSTGKELAARVAVIEERISTMRQSRAEQHKTLVADMQFLLRRMREEQFTRAEITALERVRSLATG